VISDYTPTVEELASLIPSRAAGRWTGGDASPAFPDRERVESVIEDAAGLITPALGGDELDPRFYDGGRALIKLQAALLLEPSAWPEQSRPEKSVFDQWLELLKTAKASLVEAIVRFRDTETDGPGASQGVIAAFPPAGLPVSRTIDVSVTGEVVDVPGNPSWGELGTVDW
jgi:hypothetical protein